jgi:hypothetical protein
MDEILERDNIESAILQVLHNMERKGCLSWNFQVMWNSIVTNFTLNSAQVVTDPNPTEGEKSRSTHGTRHGGTQAVAQVLTKVYGPKFSERSFGFRPGRSAHDAIIALRDDESEGYTWAADIDLSKYFDIINHDILMNILRRDIRDETVLVLIKRFLMSAVIVDGALFPTDECSPQGGNLSHFWPTHI